MQNLALLQVLDWLLDGEGYWRYLADFKGHKRGSPRSKTWGFFFGGSGRGPESSCQISAYYKFFPGKSYFNRTIYGHFKSEFLTTLMRRSLRWQTTEYHIISSIWCFWNDDNNAVSSWLIGKKCSPESNYWGGCRCRPYSNYWRGIQSNYLIGCILPVFLFFMRLHGIRYQT